MPCVTLASCVGFVSMRVPAAIGCAQGVEAWVRCLQKGPMFQRSSTCGCLQAQVYLYAASGVPSMYLYRYRQYIYRHNVYSL